MATVTLQIMMCKYFLAAVLTTTMLHKKEKKMIKYDKKINKLLDISVVVVFVLFGL